MMLFPESKYILDLTLVVGGVVAGWKHLLTAVGHISLAECVEVAFYFGVQPPLASSSCQPFPRLI